MLSQRALHIVSRCGGVLGRIDLVALLRLPQLPEERELAI
jgi:hypothetical protein